MLGLVEEGRQQARGKITDRTQWNKLNIKNENIIIERGQVVKGRIKLEDIKYTLADEKKPYKEQCGLCKLYFEKTSVIYKVPNHRIMDIQKQWNFPREGRRYNTASFIYASTIVCTFCSQLFSNEEDVNSTKGLPIVEIPIPIVKLKEIREDVIDSPDKNMITTLMKRSNIAINKRVYQSSTVDYLNAEIAINNNNNNSNNNDNNINNMNMHNITGSKTRREVDAWWEIDFNHNYHLYSINIILATAIQIPLKVHVLLLKQSLGFEDPFLDSIKKKCILQKEFILSGGNSIAKFETINWELPANTICAAARIQLYGIHTLFIHKFCAYQGDDIIEYTEEDLNITKNSFASLSPQKMHDGWLEITKSNLLYGGNNRPTSKLLNRQLSTVQSLPNFNINNINNNSISIDNNISIFKNNYNKNHSNNKINNNEAQQKVNILSKQIKNQKDAIEAWKYRAKQSANYFTIEEIFAMRDCIFHNLLQEAGIQPIEIISPIQASLPLSPSQLNNSITSTNSVNNINTNNNNNNNNNNTVINTQNTNIITETSILSNSSLIDDTHQSSMVSDKPIVSYGIFDHEILDNSLILYEPRCLLYGLSKRLRQVLRWIQSREHAKELGVLMFSDKFMALSIDSADALYKLSQAFRIVETTTEGVNNCEKDASWSQFLMIMHLFCTNHSSYIYKWVYPRNPFNLEPLLDHGLDDIGLTNHLNIKNKFNNNNNNNNNNSHMKVHSSLQDIFRASTAKDWIRANTSSSTKLKIQNNYKPLTWNDILNVDNNRPGSSAQSSFNQLKINRYKKKFTNDYKFPKTLTEAVKYAEEQLIYAHNQTLLNSGGFIKKSTIDNNELKETNNDNQHNSVASEEISLHSDDINTLNINKRPNTQNNAVGTSTPLSSTNIIPTTPIRHPNTITPNQLSSPLIKSTSFFSDPSPFFEDENDYDDKIHDFNVQSTDDLLKGFDKTCALCLRTFPKKALEMKVLWKHVIALRRSWNPKLVPKVIEALDQSITMYNLVNVCAFCSQYFDPDFPGGIAYPQKQIKDIIPDGIMGKIIHKDMPLIEYLDDRHLDNNYLNNNNNNNNMKSKFQISNFPICSEYGIKSFIDSEESSLNLSTTPLENISKSDEEWYQHLIKGSTVASLADGSLDEGLSQISTDSKNKITMNGSDYLRSQEVIKSRARAKRAVGISKEINKHNEIISIVKDMD